MNKTIDVIYYGKVFGGEGFKAQHPQGGRLRMFVKDYDNNWYSTNNRERIGAGRCQKVFV